MFICQKINISDDVTFAKVRKHKNYYRIWGPMEINPKFNLKDIFKLTYIINVNDPYFMPLGKTPPELDGVVNPNALPLKYLFILYFLLIRLNKKIIEREIPIEFSIKPNKAILEKSRIVYNDSFSTSWEYLLSSSYNFNSTVFTIRRIFKEKR